MALMLHFVQLFLEAIFVARQRIVTGTSLITCVSVTDLSYCMTLVCLCLVEFNVRQQSGRMNKMLQEQTNPTL